MNPSQERVPENLSSPEARAEQISRFLATVKVYAAQQVKTDLQRSRNRLLSRLMIRERPGRTVFRYWQEGPGYDRNLENERSVSAAIEYIHLNPVRRGLCQAAIQWRWSSARWYAFDGTPVDADLPTIHGPPPGLFGAC